MARILADAPYEIVSLADYPDAPEVEETGSTFAENAASKAMAYARFTGELTLADDSGLEVDALDGAPGVYSSRFAPSDRAQLKLLRLMKDVPDHLRAARFRCAIAIAEPDVRTHVRGQDRGCYRTRAEGFEWLRLRPRILHPRTRQAHGRAQPRREERDLPPGTGSGACPSLSNRRCHYFGATG